MGKLEKKLNYGPPPNLDRAVIRNIHPRSFRKELEELYCKEIEKTAHIKPKPYKDGDNFDM